MLPIKRDMKSCKKFIYCIDSSGLIEYLFAILCVCVEESLGLLLCVIRNQSIVVGLVHKVRTCSSIKYKSK